MFANTQNYPTPDVGFPPIPAPHPSFWYESASRDWNGSGQAGTGQNGAGSGWNGSNQNGHGWGGGLKGN